MEFSSKQATKVQTIAFWCRLSLFSLFLLIINSDLSLAQRRRPPRPLLPPVERIFPRTPLPSPVPPPVFSPLPPLLPGTLNQTTPPILSSESENDILSLGTPQGDLRIEISEKFLQQFLSKKETTTGAIQDFILGAQVQGQQTTLSTVSLNCLPSHNGARFDFDIVGVSQSATTSATPQAMIAHQGHNQFRAIKPVLFDGTKLLTKKVTIFVMPNQQVLGAESRHSRLPLLGPIADRIAYRAATAHMSQSNLIAGQKLMHKLQPQIDGQTDRNLTTANAWGKEKIWSRLEQLKLQPNKRSSFSTDNKIVLDYLFAKLPVPRNEAQKNDPSKQTGDIHLLLHQQLITTLLKKSALAGKKISLNKLVEQSNQLFQVVDPTFAEQPGSLPVEVHFTFAKTSPFKISFQNKEVEIILRGKFQLQSLPETETHRIRLTILSELNEHQAIFKVDQIDIREELPEGKLAKPGFTQRAFVTQFQTLLRDVHVSRQKTFPLNTSSPSQTIQSPAPNNNNITVNLRQLDIDNGWVDISWDVTKQKQLEPPAIVPPTLATPPFTPLTPIRPPTSSPAPSSLKFPEQNFIPAP